MKSLIASGIDMRPGACLILTFSLVMATAASSCDRDNAENGPINGTNAATQPSPWRTQSGSHVVALQDESADREMMAAIAQARATASEARRRWNAADANDRQRWFIKWTAPVDAATTEGEERVEHVWVRPLTWSAFRIEGILQSQPVTQLACGKSLGEIVSFPIDELSDWMHLSSEPDADPPFDGGFTVKVLEQRFGKPSS
jgi:uncharacterized protein YegJ (DUF2314 family)